MSAAVMCNCGFTLAPGGAEQAALVVRGIKRAEEMSPEVITRGVGLTWSSFAEYLDALGRLETLSDLDQVTAALRRFGRQ